jgi:hypothetical protein
MADIVQPFREPKTIAQVKRLRRPCGTTSSLPKLSVLLKSLAVRGWFFERLQSTGSQFKCPFTGCGVVYW